MIWCFGELNITTVNIILILPSMVVGISLYSVGIKTMNQSPTFQFPESRLTNNLDLTKMHFDSNETIGFTINF